jgi:hypothetical protein
MKALLFKFLLIAPIILAPSCAKKQGCTDNEADNYAVDAEEDDGSCYYSGGAVFYQGQASAQRMIDDGITQVKVYFDGDFIGQITPFTHWSFVPDCNSTTAVTIPDYGLGFSKSQSFSYQVKDQNNQVLISNNFSIVGNQCTAVELVY